LIERVIENWLINTNEIGYQVPFCQHLVSEGYTLLHLSSHGQMEQGKDIISFDKQGIPCAFQLKGGDIDVIEWRKIKGEIDELVEIPVNFPGISKDAKHRAVLVTNGKITDPVRRGIDDLNSSYKKRGFSELEVITKMDLLKRFLKVHDVFLPNEPSDFKLFLELLFSDGHELIDKKLTAKFIEGILFSGKETKPELKRKIASGLLLMQYLIRTFEKTKNHVSIIEGWTLFGSYVLAMVEKYELEDEYWSQSFGLVLHLINNQFDLLKSEFYSRTDYLEGSWDGGLIYKSRLTMVLGWLSAFELFNKQKNKSYILDKQVFEYIKRYYKDSTWYWGESASPFFIEMSLFVSQLGETSYSNSILVDLIAQITVENQSTEGKGFPNPYYSAEQIIGYLYKLGEKEIASESFLGSSYHASTIVDILVRRNKRTSLDVVWKDVSKLLLCEFKPAPAWKILTWHCEEGEQVELFYDHPQSWKKILDEALDYKITNLPKTLLDNPFSYFFLLCYPHRLARSSIKLIDK
jgi:hypothetical protein